MLPCPTPQGAPGLRSWEVLSALDGLGPSGYPAPCRTVSSSSGLLAPWSGEGVWLAESEQVRVACAGGGGIAGLVAGVWESEGEEWRVVVALRLQPP